MMSEGLSRKFRIAFIVQAVMACAIIILGAYIGAVTAERALLQRSLQDEAAHFWQRLDANPAHVVPDSRTLSGYLVPMGASAAALPTQFRELSPGLHELRDEGLLVLVDQRTAGRLYLAYSQSRLDWLAFSLVVVPVLLALFTVIASSWFTYRRARRLVAPLNRLAREVAQWDPRNPDVSALAPDRMSTEADAETRQLTGALYRMAERVRAFINRERDFTRDASHELRTPLTVIRVAADLLIGDIELPVRMQRSLVRIQLAGRDMEAVIDAFMILAREADIAPLSEDFAVLDVVHEEIENVRTQCQGKGLDIRIVDEARPVLHAPPRVLGVMLRNLLSNACIFTDRGYIQVRITADRIEVQDSGVGMSMDTIDRAFDLFYRADIGNLGGKGMGLSIVRRLGERFGWPVTLDSIPGKGTTATIRFA